MRWLLLLRHAKAVTATGHDDYARVLVDRGRRDAARIGAFVAEIDMIPDLMIDSGAARTRETAAIVAAKWPRRVETGVEPKLYEASWTTIQGLVRALPDKAPHAMLVAHNPGLADLASHLAGRGARSEMLHMAGKFPTCALAILEFDIDRWHDAEPGGALLARFVTPDDRRIGGE
jgi:phosphohistidine phosphatase